jgi:hypothetical protein
MLFELRHHVQLQYAMAKAFIPLQEHLMKADTLSYLSSLQYTRQAPGLLVPGVNKFSRLENLKMIKKDGSLDKTVEFSANKVAKFASKENIKMQDGEGFRDAEDLMVWLNELNALLPNPRKLEILYVPDVPEVSVIMCQ